MRLIRNFAVLLLCCISLPCFAQIYGDNLSFMLSQKLNSANDYKDHIPEDTFIESRKILESLNNNNNHPDGLTKIKARQQIRLLDIYILNSQKKADRDLVEEQIKDLNIKYEELLEINRKLESELEKSR